MNAAINAAMRYPLSSQAVRWMRWFFVDVKGASIIEIFPPCDVKDVLAFNRRVITWPVMGRRRR